MADSSGRQPVRTLATGDVIVKIANSAGMTVDPAQAYAQGSLSFGQTGLLNLGAVTATAPAYTTAQASPLSLTTAGELRINGTVSQATAASLNATVVGNVASGATDFGNGVKISGVYSAAVPVLSAGSRGDIQIDARGAVWTTPLDGSHATYSATILALAPAAAATDIFTITGSGTKTIRVTRVAVSGTQTTQSIRNFVLIKRSTADTAGTLSAPTMVAYDSNDAAATAVVAAYTANPTLGTAVGIMYSRKIWIGVAVPSGSVSPAPGTDGAMFEAVRPAKAIVLRGIAQQLAVNLNGVTIPGGDLDITVEWTEES